MAPPDPATMCAGQCEGTGVVPIRDPHRTRTASPELECGDGITIEPANETPDPRFVELWDAAEARGSSDDGWHMVCCPDCNGTGKRA